MLIQPRRSSVAVVLLAIIWLVGSSFAVSKVNGVNRVYNLIVDVSQGNGTTNVNLLSTFPVTISYSTKSAPGGSVYAWDFGDGTTSSFSSGVHSFAYPCVYDIHLRLTSPTGTVLRDVIFGAFDDKAQTGGAIAVCPSSGTVGLMKTGLAGGYFASNSNVTISLDGGGFASVKSDRGGDFVFNTTTKLPARPNGSTYTFTTFPVSLPRTFTTLEGILVQPTSGAPGDRINVTGASYPAGAAVTVLIGNATVGTAQADPSGSFQAQFQVPAVAPLTKAGTYKITTNPPILGVGQGATFVSKGGGSIITQASSVPWWLFLLVAVVAITITVVVLAWRRRRKEPEQQPVAAEGPFSEPSPEFAVRIPIILREFINSERDQKQRAFPL